MPEDLIALVTKKPVLRMDPVDIYVGYKIKESWYACIDLKIQLARPYRAKGYRISTISHAQNPASMSKNHPFWDIHEGDYVVLLHPDQYTIVLTPNPNNQYDQDYDHLALEDAARHNYVEVRPEQIKILDSKTIVLGSIAEEIQKNLGELGHRAIKALYFDEEKTHDSGDIIVETNDAYRGHRKLDGHLKHVFISYVRENSNEVDQLKTEFMNAGVKVWLDRDMIEPGERWKIAIRNAIREGAFFIACFSSQYAARDRTYMNEELTLAIEELRSRFSDRSWFLPVTLDGTKIPDMPIGRGETLNDLQYVDLNQDWDTGIHALISTIIGH